MDFPEPYAGLVIRYSYLWKREQATGREEGSKKRLGLDAERSWIMITEANQFLWPGPDLRPVPGADVSTIACGPLPPRFFAHVRDKFLERDQREKSARVRRTE
jgi:hypothetical protein